MGGRGSWGRVAEGEGQRKAATSYMQPMGKQAQCSERGGKASVAVSAGMGKLRHRIKRL